MNKEEFELKLRQFLNNQVYIMAYRFNYDSARIFNDELIDYIKDLQKENKHLKERIDKAIEYIKYCLEEHCEDSCDYLDNQGIGEKLLEMLKGSTNG